MLCSAKNAAPAAQCTTTCMGLCRIHGRSVACCRSLKGLGLTVTCIDADGAMRIMQISKSLNALYPFISFLHAPSSEQGQCRTSTCTTVRPRCQTSQFAFSPPGWPLWGLRWVRTWEKDIRAAGAQSCVTTIPERSYVMDRWSAYCSEGPRILADTILPSDHWKLTIESTCQYHRHAWLKSRKTKCSA